MLKEISHFIIIVGYIMNNEIILRIKSLFPDFTKSEKKVALYMSQHMPQITYLSIGDLANQCEVGETTILRFCKRLGFSGYYELKQQVILEIQKNEEEIHQNLPTTLNRIHTMVEETTQLLDKEKMRQTVSMIMNSQTIYMFGSGFSVGLSMSGGPRMKRSHSCCARVSLFLIIALQIAKANKLL